MSHRTLLPPDPMQIVATLGGYDLLYRPSGDTIDVFAQVPTHRQEKSETFTKATLLSALPLLLHALLDLIEHAQPGGWELGEEDADESTAWHNAFVAVGTALGENIDWRWIPTDPAGPPV